MQDAMKSRSSSITPRFDTRGQFFASLGGQFFISPDKKVDQHRMPPVGAGAMMVSMTDMEAQCCRLN
jgi:hypothetical protein